MVAPFVGAALTVTAVTVCLTAAIWLWPDCSAAAGMTASCIDPSLAQTGAIEYAESFDPNSFLKMPFNAAVNIGYAIVGLVWWRKIRSSQASGSVSDVHRYFLWTFVLLSMGYGPIQFRRIITQEWRWGVLDQWYTPPFFAFAAYMSVWCVCETPNKRMHGSVSDWYHRNVMTTAQTIGTLILGVSSASYVFALRNPRTGFDTVLGLHILITVGCCTLMLFSGSDDRLRARLIGPFLSAFVCCIGFVVLKLYDHELASWSGHRAVTGHFVSKICDFLQIHFMLQFVHRKMIHNTTGFITPPATNGVNGVNGVTGMNGHRD